MSGKDVAHVASVDRGLKMKIKRTKVPGSKGDSKHEGSNKSDTSNNSGPGSASSSSSSGSSSNSSKSSVSGGLISSCSSSTPGGTPVSLSSSNNHTSTSTSSSSSTAHNSSSSNMPNPTVTLLKASNAGISSDYPSGKSPVKNSALGNQSNDMKDGKSPKPKAVFNKKGKDFKTGKDSSSSSNQISSHTFGGVSSGGQTFTTMTSSGVLAASMTSEPRPGDTVHVKRENLVHDPYDFNDKDDEDNIELPPKKLKLEKIENPESATSPQPPHPHNAMAATSTPSPKMPQQQQHQQHSQHHNQQQQQQQQQHQQQIKQEQQQQDEDAPRQRSVGTTACNVGINTEAEHLGPCEPGTTVGLEGIVWKETDNGVLVVNVTWRGKTYVGTLMDATKYEWAPPRPSDFDSPSDELEARGGKGRGKRTRGGQPAAECLPVGRKLRKGRTGRATVNSNSSNFTAPPSPAKSETGSLPSNASVVNNKRKAPVGKTEAEVLDQERVKRSRSSSRGAESESPIPAADGYITCPEPNCNKKYKHANGLRYHRTHAHRKNSEKSDGVKEDEYEEEEDEDELDKSGKIPLSERAERMRAKEKQRVKDLTRGAGSDVDSKDSLDDDIPLKEIAKSCKSKQDSTKNDNESDSNNETGSNDGGSVSGKSDTSVVQTKVNSAHNSLSVKSNNKSNSDASLPSSSASSTIPPSPLSTSVPLIVTCDSSYLSPAPHSPTLAAGPAPSPAVMTTLRSPITSQVYQITSHRPGAAPGLVSAPTMPLSASSKLPTLSSSTTTTSVLGLALHADRLAPSGKASSGAKTVMSSARPIVPAPTTQFSGHHSQMSSANSSLKHIQPKPTVMGDFPPSNTSLSDLSKDKNRKLKKKKDSPTVPAQPGSGNPAFSRDSMSIDSQRQSGTPSKPFNVASPSLSVDGFSAQSPPSFQNINGVVQKHSSGLGPEQLVGARGPVPPSSLSVVPPKSPIPDTAHSPAYSDISDANDSCAADTTDSPSKKEAKKDNLNIPQLNLGPDGNPLPHYSNTYYFGGQTNYMPPHGLQQPRLSGSPSLSKNGPSEKEIPKDIRDSRPSSRGEEPRDKRDVRDNRDGTPSSKEADHASLMKYYSHIHPHGVPPPQAVQMHYSMAGYPPIDAFSAQALAAQQDPVYRQHLAEQQKRHQIQQQQHHQQQQQHDLSIKGEDNIGHRGPPGVQPSNKGPTESLGDPKRPHSREGEHRQNENHQILKENIELKSQMGSVHPDQQNFHHLTPKEQQRQLQIRRHQQMQQQQHQQQLYNHQQQKLYDAQRTEKRGKGPSDLPILPGGRDSRPIDLVSSDSIKKEHKDNNSKPDPRMTALDPKRYEVKDEFGQRSSSSSTDVKPRPPSRPNIPGGRGTSLTPSSSSSSQPSSSSSRPLSSVSPSSSPHPTPLPTSVINNFAPPLSATPLSATGFPPYLGHIHPMYRGIAPHHQLIGYPPGAAPGGYMHPPQTLYRMPGPPGSDGDPGKLPSGMTPSSEANGKSGVHLDHVDNLKPPSGDSPRGGASLGGNLHKIHELSDKGRSSSPRDASPTPSKVGDRHDVTAGSSGDKVKDKQRSSSPPTQRHVHTHHHTHVVGPGFPVYAPEALGSQVRIYPVP